VSRSGLSAGSLPFEWPEDSRRCIHPRRGRRGVRPPSNSAFRRADRSLSWMCRRKDSNLHEGLPRRILNPLRLPFRHFGLKPAGAPPTAFASPRQQRAALGRPLFPLSWGRVPRWARPPKAKRCRVRSRSMPNEKSGRPEPSSRPTPPEVPSAWTPAPLQSGTRGLTPLGQVLVRTHEAMHQKTGALMTREEWTAIVGERIAARTRVGHLIKGDLVVNVASSAWAQELGFLTDAIVKRLCAAGRDVRRIRMRVEPSLASQESRGRRGWSAGPRPETAPPELPEELVQRLANVEDPHLRAAIFEAAKRSLNRAPR
jgi:hypothetical protein